MAPIVRNNRSRIRVTIELRSIGSVCSRWVREKASSCEVIFAPRLRSLGCSFEITSNAFVCAPTNCEFEIAKHRRQQVIEVVRYATGHLTDHFHFLCLLKGRLGLPTFSDLLAQLFIRLFELAGPLADQIFQLRRRRLTVEEVVLHLVLTPTSAQRGANSAG